MGAALLWDIPLRAQAIKHLNHQSMQSKRQKPSRTERRRSSAHGEHCAQGLPTPPALSSAQPAALRRTGGPTPHWRPPQGASCSAAQENSGARPRLPSDSTDSTPNSAFNDLRTPCVLHKGLAKDFSVRTRRIIWWLPFPSCCSHGSQRHFTTLQALSHTSVPPSAAGIRAHRRLTLWSRQLCNRSGKGRVPPEQTQIQLPVIFVVVVLIFFLTLSSADNAGWCCTHSNAANNRNHKTNLNRLQKKLDCKAENVALLWAQASLHFCFFKTL